MRHSGDFRYARPLHSRISDSTGLGVDFLFFIFFGVWVLGLGLSVLGLSFGFAVRGATLSNGKENRNMRQKPGLCKFEFLRFRLAVLYCSEYVFPPITARGAPSFGV